MPQWQRKELETILKVLQRTANTAVKKLEIKQVLWQQHPNLQPADSTVWHIPAELVSLSNFTATCSLESH